MKVYATIDIITGEVTYLTVPMADQCDECKENNPDLRHDEDCSCDMCRRLRGEFNEELVLPF